MLQKFHKNNTERKTMLLAAACVFLVGLFLQGCTGRLGTPNSYNSYALQAARWLEGHLDLGQNYSHLEIAAFNGRYFVSFPPFPSVVLLPFVLLFGTATPDGLISLWFAAAGAALAAKLSFLYGKSEKEAFFWAVFITIGSNLLSIMCTGWVWFMAQTMAFTFLLAAFCAAKQGKTRCALLLTACAAGCRPFSVLCLFYALLNGLRFGNPLEFGHNYLPEFLAEPQFGFGYVAENAKTLVRLPAIGDGRLVFPEFNGFNFFLASPLFISCLCRLIRHKKDAADWLSAGLLLTWLLLFCMHRTMGGWHFGHRYTIDLLPPALWLILRKKGDFSGHIPLFFLGFSLHFYGFLTL